MKVENRPDLLKLDRMAREALASEKAMDLILNGAILRKKNNVMLLCAVGPVIENGTTMMSVNNDTLRGVVRVLARRVNRDKTHMLSSQLPTSADADENENILAYRVDAGWFTCKWHAVAENYFDDIAAWQQLPAAPGKDLEAGE